MKLIYVTKVSHKCATQKYVGIYVTNVCRIFVTQMYVTNMCQINWELCKTDKASKYDNFSGSTHCYEDMRKETMKS